MADYDFDKIKCDYCGRGIIIPYDNHGVFMWAGFDKDGVMLVLLCLFCGAINDLFYDFRESQAEDYVTKEPPWKDDKEYKEAIQVGEMVQFILFNSAWYG